MRPALAIVLAAGIVRVGAAQQPEASSAQLRRVAAASRRFTSRDSARSAGFVPVFGWLPTMGTHFVDTLRMDKAHFDMLRPDNLMYSPINGKDSLVGVAYAYFTAAGDTAHPATFDGNPPWHEHPNLAPPGQTLVMLHVWFVPSPDGPFAGHNANLPFWAAGLEPPPTIDLRARKTALALAEVVDTVAIFPNLSRRPSMAPRLAEWRGQVRGLIPRLDAAQKAGDWSRWNAVADSAAAIWDAMSAAYFAERVPAPIQVRMHRFIDDMLGAGHHDMPGMH
ncbi:MAG: hypothetical protein ACHQU8_00775 [Gemmatimonadales bacterium]